MIVENREKFIKQLKLSSNVIKFIFAKSLFSLGEMVSEKLLFAVASVVMNRFVYEAEISDTQPDIIKILTSTSLFPEWKNTKYIIDAMEGQISVESKPNEGTQFQIVLDVERGSDCTAKAAPAAKQEVRVEGLRVLLAEDNELNREIAVALLSRKGIIVEEAENGQICVDKLKAAAVGYYDAVLMDLRMPVMNGYEATKAIRALDRADAKLPIIAMTADAFAEDMQRCLEVGMNAHMAKPIDVDKLVSLLAQVCV